MSGSDRARGRQGEPRERFAPARRAERLDRGEAEVEVGGRDLAVRFKIARGEREPLVLVTIEDLTARGERILDERCAEFGLTPREREVVRLLCRGLQNKEIARELRVTGQTVKNHLKRITRRTGIDGRTALARLFLTAYPAGPPPSPSPPSG